MSRSTLPKPAAVTFRRSPREFLAMFLERWWLGLLLGVAIGALLFFLTPRPVPIYRTDVSLLFESRKSRVLAMQEIMDTTLQTASELNTHLEQLRSKTFLEYLLSSFTPDEVSRIQQAYVDPLRPGAPPRPLAEIIQQNSNIYNRRGTTIIGISVSNRNPESAALIANRYARKYIDFNLDRANTGTNSAIIFLRNQAEDMRAEVEAAETALQVYRGKNGMASLGETKDVTLQKVTSLGGTSVAAQLVQIETKSLLDTIDDYQKNRRDLAEIGKVASSLQVAAAKSTLASLQTQRAVLDQRYLARHPKIIENQLAIQEARRELEEGVAKAVAGLRASFELNAQHLQRLQKEMTETETQVRQLDKVAVDYKFLEQDALTKRSAYTRIVDRLGEAKITSQMENTTIKVFDTAVVPSSPSETGTDKIIGKSAAAGMLCLFGLPILIGLMDTRIRSPYHVEKVLNQKLIGAIEPLRKMSAKERANAFRQERDAGLTESWRGIYSEIELTSSLVYPRMVVVSSSIPGEGKSQISSNLAATFAKHKRRVLLVDADLRRPCLHEYFDASPAVGWTDWLQQPVAGRPPLPKAIVNVDENFDFLPAGKLPKNPTELIETLSQRKLLEQWVKHYDVVMFDTPPVTVFPDALLLARSCHELIYVVRYSTIRARVVAQALERFRETGIALLGVVLNRLPKSKLTSYGNYDGYGSYGSKYYYKYGNEREAKSDAA